MTSLVKHIITFLILGYSSFGWSQLDSYPLVSFNQPEFYRKVSNVTPSVSFSSILSRTENNDDNPDLTNGFGLGYFFSIDKYNEKHQSNYSFFGSSSLSSRTDLTNKLRSNMETVMLNLDHRYFLNSDDFFVGIDITTDNYLNYVTQKRKIDFEFEPYRQSFTLETDNTAIINFGKGRVQNVNTAWHAIRILETVCINSDLNPDDISHDQITDFANKLGEIQNIRITDSRLEFNKEIETVYNYLKAQKLISEEDYYLFTQVLDAYRFESFALRRKGSEFYIGMGVIYDNYTRHRNNSINEVPELDDYERIEIATKIGSLVEIGANYHRPLNHHLQFSFLNSLELSRFKEKVYSNNTENTSPPNDNRTEFLIGNLTNTLQLDYLLSRRINVFFGYSSIVDYNNNLSEEMLEEPIGINHSHALNSTLQYYFSPWHTLGVNLFIVREKGYKNIKSKSIFTSFSLNSIYYFH